MKKFISLVLVVVLFLLLCEGIEGKGRRKRRHRRRGGDVMLAKTLRLVDHLHEIMRRYGETPQVVVFPLPVCGSEGQPPCPEIKKLPAPVKQAKHKRPRHKRRR